MRNNMRGLVGATALLLVACTRPPWRRRGPWHHQRRRRPLYPPGRRAGGPFQRLSAAIPVERAVLHRHSQGGRDLPGRRPGGPGAAQRAGRDADCEREGEQRHRRSDCGRYSSEHASGWSSERRGPAGRGPVYGHDCDGETESDEAPAVSVTGAHDRLSAAGPVPWPSRSLGVLLVAWLGYKLLRSTWLRNWWTVLRS